MYFGNLDSSDTLSTTILAATRNGMSQDKAVLTRFCLRIQSRRGQQRNRLAVVHSKYSFVRLWVTPLLTTPSLLETAHLIRALDRVLGALLYLSVLGVRGGPGVVALLGHAALTDHWSALTLLHHGAVSALPCTPPHPATSNCQIFWLPGRGSSSPATC